MGKKRKSVVNSLEEVDRSMYSTFRGAANSLSQLYTQSMNLQKLSFQAGERHALDKLYQWILSQQEGGSRLTTPDVVNYLQTELDYYGEEPSMSPRPPVQNQHLTHFMNSGAPLASSGSSGVTDVGPGFRSETFDQSAKNYIFSNALSSPVRRSLQNYNISQGGYFSNSIQPSANGIRSNENQNRNSNSINSHDSNMDMQADSPNHDSNY